MLIQGIIPAPSTKLLRRNTIMHGVIEPKIGAAQADNFDGAEGLELYASIEAFQQIPLSSLPKPLSSIEEEDQQKKG
jgi:hypothetical protein